MTAWSNHVKAFAKRKGIKYQEAAKSEECKKSYRRKRKTSSERKMNMNGARNLSGRQTGRTNLIEGEMRRLDKIDFGVDDLPCAGHCNEGFDCETCYDIGDKACKSLCQFSRQFRLSVKLEKLYNQRFEKLGKDLRYVQNFGYAKSYIQGIEDLERKAFPVKLRLLSGENIPIIETERLIEQLERKENNIEKFKQKVLKLLGFSEKDL